MIRVKALGAVHLEGPDAGRAAFIVAQPKRLALLIYLLLASPRTFHRREKLLALFWPDLDEEHARRALRQAAYLLRRALGNNVVLSRGAEEIGLDGSQLWCDATAFDQALDRGDYATALELYGGELIEGLHVSGASADFERWLDAERGRLRNQAAEAASRLSADAQASGDLAESERHARTALTLAPYDEQRLRRLMEVLDKRGNRAEALRLYEQFRSLLASELEVEPSPETRAATAVLRSREASVHGTRVPVSPPAQAASGIPTGGAQGDAAGTRRKVRRPVRVIGVTAVLVAASVAALLLVKGASPSTSGLSGTRVMIPAFSNETGDSSLDALGRMAGDWVTRSLSGTGLLQVVAPGPLLRFRPVDQPGAFDRLSPTLQALAATQRANVVFWGAYSRRGDSLEFSVAMASTRGKVDTMLSPIRVPVSQAYSALELVRSQVAAALGRRVDGRIAVRAAAEAPPPKPDAYAEFLEAEDEIYVRVGTHSRAGDHYRRALVLDSTFLLAMVRLTINRLIAQDLPGADSIASAVRAREIRPSLQERVVLDWADAAVRHDLVAVHRAVHRLSELAAGDDYLQYHHVRSAQAAGYWKESIALLQQLDPTRYLYGDYWWLLTHAHHMLGQHREELAAARRGSAQYPGELRNQRYQAVALAALGRTEELNTYLDSIALGADAVGRGRGLGSVLVQVATELRTHNHDDATRPLLDKALGWYRGVAATGVQTAGLAWGRYDALYQAGRWDEAQLLLDSLVADDTADVGNQGYLGILAARRGDRGTAMRILGALASRKDEIRRRNPDIGGFDTLYRACIVALLGNRDSAVTLLRQALDEGVRVDALHAFAYDLDALRDYPPFLELLKPRG